MLGALDAYVLTSAARAELALAPLGARHTAFTGELIRLLARGDPDGPALLRLSYAYQYLNRVLPAAGFPKPHRRASGSIDDLVLAPNPAHHPSEDAPPKQDSAGPELDECPYPGLAAFQTEEARWFFGRERVTTELMGRLAARLEQARPLVLVGVSGSGKSSLLRAGLLPALSEGTLLVPGSHTWPQLLFTPTTDPVGELAAQVAQLAGVASDLVRAELVANPEGFAGTVQRALAARVGAVSGARVVIVVDQFEETFLRCAQERDRQVFIRALCAAAGASDGEWSDEPPALVVLGIRADLYGCCAGYPELVPALQDGQVVLGPMRSAELRAAIEGPAHTAGLTLEPGLVETLLHELGAGNGSAGTGFRSAATYDPGALPLLSHALHATWEHRAQRVLTVAGYQATGGIHGAVATTAEATYQGFDPAGQQAARRLLLHMVQLGDGVADTRLRADRTTLIAHSPDPTAAAAVFDAFAHVRLITAAEDSAEITHEALLRAWPRLRSWIDADRAGLYVHQQLTETAQGWDRDGRPDAALYRDTDLAVAQDWAQEPDPPRRPRNARTRLPGRQPGVTRPPATSVPTPRSPSTAAHRQSCRPARPQPDRRRNRALPSPFRRVPARPDQGTKWPHQTCHLGGVQPEWANPGYRQHRPHRETVERDRSGQLHAAGTAPGGAHQRRRRGGVQRGWAHLGQRRRRRHRAVMGRD
ncbi:MAG: AAA family ATPase [Pseudonocardiaceae bacterium]